MRETGLDSRLQARSFAALTVHWTVIHYRSYFKSRESLRNAKKEAVIVTASLFLVRETGLEPVRVAPHAPQTCASADSATLAYSYLIVLIYTVCLKGKQTRIHGTACGSQNFLRLGAPQNFDRYAISNSLHPPPAALRSECCRFRHSRINTIKHSTSACIIYHYRGSLSSAFLIFFALILIFIRVTVWFRF